MPENKPKKADPTPWEAMEWVWDILLGIAVPTTLFALAGRWLDKRYSTSPWFTVVGLVLALIVVYIIVMRKGKDISKRL
ncbi:MAG: AtpZ/AtpI family protein [Patescibacteria group bacterium]